MDEYIKKSDLKAELLRRDFYPAIVKSALETIPPADVVPRAMIAEIFGEIDDILLMFKPQYFVDAPHLNHKRLTKALAELKKKHTEGTKND
jgi:hypothetical protein